MYTQYHNDDVQVWQWLNVNQTCSVNTFSMKDRKKINAMKEKHYELENALRNHERNDSDDLNDALNDYTESVSSCDVIKKSDERRERWRRNKLIKFLHWKHLQYKAQKKVIS